MWGRVLAGAHAKELPVRVVAALAAASQQLNDREHATKDDRAHLGEAAWGMIPSDRG